ncbi:MAG: METTL5 family protein [Candidatus Hydrothermarchaeales archaeon]
MLSKKELELLLESCNGFREPKAKLEQYVTPSPIAANLLNLASLKGDIVDKTVFDLGCGTGRLAIGAALLGAREVTGFDIDCDTLSIAKENAEKLNSTVRWKCLDVVVLNEECDTVIQNPPFGVQKRGADRPFISSAMQMGKVIYTMHKTTTRDFIKKYIEKLGGRITDIDTVDFSLPYSYCFHKKRIKRIEVDVYRIERRA